MNRYGEWFEQFTDPRTFVYGLCLVLVGVSLFTGFYFLEFTYLTNPDAERRADFARNIYEDFSFTTQAITPLYLTVHPKFKNHPDLQISPFFPVLVAISFAMFGVSNFAVVLVDGVFFILSGLVVMWLGWTLFGREIGFVSGLLFLTSPVMVAFSLKGLTELVFIALVWSGLILIYQGKSPYLVGVLLGASYLTRSILITWIPGIVFLYCCFYENPKEALIKSAGTFVMVASPWWARNYFVAGSPTFSFHRYEIVALTSIYPQHDIFRSMELVDPLQFIWEYPLAYAQKVYQQLRKGYLVIPLIFKNFFLALLGFYGGVRVMESRATQSEVREFFVGLSLMFFVQLLFMGLVIAVARFFVPFLPVIYVLVAYVCFEEFHSYSIRGITLRPILAGVIAISLFYYPRLAFGTDAQPRQMEYVQSVTPEDSVIVTNAIGELPWYADRIALLAPTYRDFVKINNKISRIDYAFFARRATGGASEKYDIIRNYLANNKFRSNFEIIKTFKPSAILLKRKSTGTD